MKIQSIKELNFEKKSPENLLKYLHINLQIWFQKYNFKTQSILKIYKYVCSLRTPVMNLYEFSYLRNLNSRY